MDLNATHMFVVVVQAAASRRLPTRREDSIASTREQLSVYRGQPDRVRS